MSSPVPEPPDSGVLRRNISRCPRLVFGAALRSPYPGRGCRPTDAGVCRCSRLDCLLDCEHAQGHPLQLFRRHMAIQVWKRTAPVVESEPHSSGTPLRLGFDRVQPNRWFSRASIVGSMHCMVLHRPSAPARLIGHLNAIPDYNPLSNVGVTDARSHEQPISTCCDTRVLLVWNGASTGYKLN
jgi:hypothetical protein